VSEAEQPSVTPKSVVGRAGSTSSGTLFGISLDEVVGRLRAGGCAFAEEEATLLGEAAASRAELDAFLIRRLAGEPLEYIVGWAAFCGLRVSVVPGVFVPRRRTEFLVDRTVALAAGWEHPVVVDVCCGSGAIGRALAERLGGIELYATDIDPVAVGCARTNLGENGLVFEGDMYEPLPSTLRGRVGLLTANAPYVPTGEIATMPREARLHEARVTLDGGHDGLDMQRRVAAGASAWLKPGGHVIIETSDRQADRTAYILSGAGLKPVVERSAEIDATVVTGTRR
jgi:release factor glutamine methyltransferase